MIQFNRKIIRFVFFANVRWTIKNILMKNYWEKSSIRLQVINLCFAEWKNAKNFGISWNHEWINNMLWLLNEFRHEFRKVYV
jgi:hypothetical protein